MFDAMRGHCCTCQAARCIIVIFDDRSGLGTLFVPAEPLVQCICRPRVEPDGTEMHFFKLLGGTYCSRSGTVSIRNLASVTIVGC